MRCLLGFIASCLFAFPFLRNGTCETFPLSSPAESVVGELRYVNARSDETLIDIAREFDLGYDQIVKANPEVNRWLPDEGAEVLLPQIYILPGAVRRGLVLNISELRIYYYPTPKKGEPQEVRTYPVSIGRMDWRTPLGATKVTQKERDPAWRPPKSIREEHARDGDPLPEVIPGGRPDNPLGRFALRLGLPSYLIHGVDERKSFGIGMRVTHGCVRMYPEDIEQLFGLVSVNNPVMIVDEPIKIGRRDGSVFLSVHQPLDEGEDESLPPLPRVSLDKVLHLVKAHLGPNYQVPFELVRSITDVGDGIPHEIAQALSAAPVTLVRSPPQQVAPHQPAPQQPAPQRDSFDEQYFKALAKHLNDDDVPPTPVPPAMKRRAPVNPSGTDDDDAVRNYVTERY